MPRRFVFAVVAVLALLVVLYACRRDDDDAQPAERTAAASSTRANAPLAQDASSASIEAGTAAHRSAALHEAVDVVQRYLAAAGSADWPKADALWGYRRAPAPGEEGGLRALMPPRAMRIENQTPRMLDAEPVPAYIEVPVRLRIDGQDGVQHRYAGWYRLRRNPVEQRWELTSASVSAQMR